MNRMLLKLAFFACVTGLIRPSRHDSLPKELPERMYCAGCQATIKALSAALHHPSSKKLDTRVETALKEVCDKKKFENTDLSAKYLLMSCEHLVQNHRTELKEMLTDHYSKQSRKGKTYLDIAHKVCNEETFACTGGEPQKDPTGNEGSLYMDEETGDFKLKPGNNVRMVNPVREVKDEL